MTTSHPGAALSALLDGELDATEAEAVRIHVEMCADCAAELDGIRLARRSIRALPAVEPPPGFLESLQPDSNVVLLRRHRRRTLAANVSAAAATVAAAVILLSTTPAPATAVAAQPQGAADRHDATVAAISAATGTGGDLVLPTRSVPPTTAPVRAVDALPSHLVAPEELAGYRLTEAYHLSKGVHLLYERGEHRLSVFQQEGDLRRLPTDVTRIDDVWRWDDPRVDGKVVVTQRGSVVVTVVGDESARAVLDAARALPPATGGGSESFGTRLRRACGDVLESLSPVAS